jgi:hypothetical protein
MRWIETATHLYELVVIVHVRPPQRSLACPKQCCPFRILVHAALYLNYCLNSYCLAWLHPAFEILGRDEVYQNWGPNAFPLRMAISTLPSARLTMSFHNPPCGPVSLNPDNWLMTCYLGNYLCCFCNAAVHFSGFKVRKGAPREG